jgi:CRP/FNR family transcriptional regulator, anaerobic regulatory protein
MTPTMNTSSSTNTLHQPIAKCSTCAMGQFCLPVGITLEDAQQLDSLVKDRIRLKKNETLFQMGTPLKALYGIRFGTLKSQLTLEDGRMQIIGFHFPGEIVGLDGIGEHKHLTDVYALEDSEVCVLHYDYLEDLSREIPSLQHQLHRIMSREIMRDQRMLLALGSMRAEERLATFLLNLSERFASRGYSSSEFMLRMSREEIGSFLGLKLETVSRLFSRFADSGMITIRQRHVKLIDLEKLNNLAGHSACH